jgi:hypothetical protein
MFTNETSSCHCERSEAIQSSVPHRSASNKLPIRARSNPAAGGTDDWIDSSLRSRNDDNGNACLSPDEQGGLEPTVIWHGAFTAVG